jgi:hypothetical protein
MIIGCDHGFGIVQGRSRVLRPVFLEGYGLLGAFPYHFVKGPIDGHFFLALACGNDKSPAEAQGIRSLGQKTI